MAIGARFRPKAVMVRFTVEEHAQVVNAKPAWTPMAQYLRQLILEAVAPSSSKRSPSVRTTRTVRRARKGGKR